MTGYREDPLPLWFKVILVLTRLAVWGWVLGLIVLLAREAL